MTTASHHDARDFHVTRELVRTGSMGLGVVFLLLGVLAFVPGLTTQYGSLAFASGSEALLFGVFQVSILLNIVYLIVGAAGIIMSRDSRGSRNFLLGSGALFLIMWIYGVVIDLGSTANFLSFNAAGNWLHLILALVAGGIALTHMARTRGGSQSTHT
ncbi:MULTISPECIES: DUF4383 domain-containing protein [unclassified Arthrobacter]|uniref:DUF4383 domain-containing protein n=1 Tax=unclassified Arthrobacter TaxID=235627 RepID=UPI001491A513|nr:MULTISPECIES: DUF4383 domain-containing protein [unclassified Arthrobacter]MBE0010733.1 DUF4383 domain-containing protein [Arthrobacter sp. AET 35A]NOJ64585.1 DUF4383 domain-containing protein [Arthrobacter sp. 147(2020)]